MNVRIIFSSLLLAAGLPAMGEVIEVETDTSRVHDLDEVVVVSQPKEQVRLRLQPLSSTVVAESQMNALGVRDMSRLSQFVPSFVVPDYGSRLTSSMYVRGIGSRVNNPAVGIYYDGVPLISKAAFNSHFYMIDRIDVLRGSQGTLYGQNTEGGLVRIYSKNPMHYQGTDVALGLGTGLYSNVEVAHYHRPSDAFAFSAAGFYSGLKGFIDNQNFKEKNDLKNEAGGRMRFVYTPAGRISFDLTADYQYVNQNGFGYGEFSPQENSVQNPATTFMNGYKRNMLNTGLNVRYWLNGLLLTSTTSYQYLNDQMLMDQDYLAPDYLRLSQRQKQSGVTQELVLRSDPSSLFDNPLSLITNPSSLVRSEVWRHTTGLFGSYQWLRTDAPVGFGDAITGPIGQSIANAMKSSMVQAFTGRFIAQGMSAEQAAAAARQAVDAMGVTMSAEMAVPERFRTPQLNLAAYHESNVLLGDRLTLTAGLRLDYNRVKISYDALAYMSITGGTAQQVDTYTLTSQVADELSKSYTQLLPKLGFTYDLGTGRGNVFGVVSKGYRSGGYNIQMFSDILQTDLNANQQQAMRGDYDVPHGEEEYKAIEEAISYEPEESWNFEVGSHLNLFEGRVHADVALYYMKIRNQQLSQMSPLYNYGRIMVNAGKSHSLGAELTLRGQALASQLDWSATYGYTSAKFDDYSAEMGGRENSGGGSVDEVPLVSYDGNRVPFVPEHTVSIAADWHFSPLFTLGLNLTGQGRTWWDEANTYAQKFYAVLGAHADFNIGPAVVSLWARNITDTKYNTFAVSSSAAGSMSYFAQRANPFHAGIDVRLHF